MLRELDDNPGESAGAAGGEWGGGDEETNTVSEFGALVEER
jgi:hypothetical protein